MWSIFEHRRVVKQLKKAPRNVQVDYVTWKRIIELQGPKGLRLIKGFHDETLKGEWFGFRSSRLTKKWRVIYKPEKKRCLVFVVEVNPHEY